MSETRLNQIVAVEKGIKQRVNNNISKIYHNAQKQDLFEGFYKKYTPVNEDGETYDPDKRKVTLNVTEILEDFSSNLIELFDITSVKDFTNCNAKADIVIGEICIGKDVPATYLLFLEKQLNDIKTFIEKLPLLDESENWEKDINTNLYKSEPNITYKTKKIQEALVLYNHTDKHPAQTQVITKDVTIGSWENIYLSGALPKPIQKQIMDKVLKLIKAVKFAREEANNIVVEPDQKIGEKIFNYLLG